MSSTDYTTNVPGAGLYAQADNAATTAYQNAIAQIGQKRQGLLTNYGYKADFSPTTGAMSNLTVDQGNSTGQLQQMLRGNAAQDYATRDANASRGIHGGLAEQGLSENSYQHAVGAQALGQGFLQGVQGFANDQQQAGQTKNDTLYQAQLQQAQLAIQNQQFNPANYSGLQMPDYNAPDWNTLLQQYMGDGSGGSGTSGGSKTSVGSKAVLPVGVYPGGAPTATAKEKVAATKTAKAVSGYDAKSKSNLH